MRQSPSSLSAIPPLTMPPLVLAAFAGIASTSLHAQTASGEPAARQLEAVTITAPVEHGEKYAPARTSTAIKGDAPLRDVPQSVQIITEEVMRDQGVRSMQDALKNTPSIGLMAGDGQRDAFVIRGFNALFDVLLDGVRDDAQYYRDLYNIERIEVIKGPAAVLYGRGSSGGLINRVTKKPDFNPSAEVGVTVGSYQLRRGEFSLNRPLSETLAFRLDGALEESQSFRANNYIRSQALSPGLLWKDGPQSLLLQYDYQNQHRSIDFGVPALNGRPVDISNSIYYGSRHSYANDFANTLVRQSTARYEYKVSDTTRISNTLRYYSYRLDRNENRLGSVNDLLPDPTITFRRANVYRDDSGWFNQTELTHSLSHGNVRHDLLVGVELGRQDRFVDSRNSVPPVSYTTSLFNPVLQDLPFTVTTTPLTRGKAVQTTRAIYIQDMTAWTPTIKTLLGLRYDSFGQEFTDTRTANWKYLERTDNNISPRAGIVWQPTPMQSYYASISRSYQPSGEAQPLTANNEQLGPEKSTNIEIGSKIDILEGRATFTAALYQLTRTDIKVSDPSNPGALIRVGEQRARGLELGLNGSLTPGLQVIAGYSYMDTEVTKAFGTITSPYSSASPTPLLGKTLASSPRHVASIWLLKSLDSWLPGLQAAGGVLYRSQNYSTLTNAVALPAFTTVDLAAYYRPARKGLSLALNFKNVFNRKYFISANNDVGAFPGAPRSVELTARYAF